jgi:nucleoside-diphosphate-sugar epimerase
MGNSLRVAVTGGSGKIGSALVRKLLELGHAVVNLDLVPPEEPSDARFVQVDLRDRAQVKAAFEHVDVVCHLGEIPHAHHDGMPPAEIFAANTAIGSTVLQTAADLKLRRVIYTSSCQVYGCWGNRSRIVPPVKLPMDETQPLRPQNVYALSKVANEGYARFIAGEHGILVAAFRFPWVVMRRPTDERALQHLATSDGPTEGMGSYLFLDDAVSAYLNGIDREVPGFQAYHFAAPDVWSAVPIRARLQRHHPDFPPLPDDWPDFKCPVDCSRAHTSLGWSAHLSVRQAFAEWKGGVVSGR